MVVRRKCFVTIGRDDFECLKRVVSETSEAYHDLHAALDAGNGTVSLRCEVAAAEALLAVARRDCEGASEAIRSAIAVVRSDGPTPQRGDPKQ